MASDVRRTASLDAPPVALFQGYDTFKSAGRSTAVKGESRSSGARATTFYEVCTDFASLQQALDVSASVSASFGFGAVDGKAKFIDDLRVTSYALTIVVYTNIVTAAESFTNVQLVGPPPSDINEFYRVHGDSFLGQVVSGAEYGAAYVFYAESSAEQTQIKATLEANGILQSGSLSGSLQASLENVQQKVSTRQQFKQFMHGFLGRPSPTPDKIVNFALEFGKEPPNAPVVLSYKVTGYEHVRGVPESFSSSVGVTRALYNGAGVDDGLADAYAELRVLQDSIDSIMSIYDTYGYSDDTALMNRRATLKSDIRTLDKLFDAMASDPTRTFTVPPLESWTWGRPSLSVRLNKVGPFGTRPSIQQPAQVNEGSVSSQTVVKRVSACGGFFLDRLETKYKSGSKETTFPMGGGGGAECPPLSLQEKERIKAVSVAFTDLIVKLTIETSFGNQLSCPPNPVGAIGDYHWKAEGSTVFLGFSGAADIYVSQLAIITATFSPASWSTLKRSLIASAVRPVISAEIAESRPQSADSPDES